MNTIEPINSTNAFCEDTFTHEAFGTISLGIVKGGDATLFGSDLKHDQRIHITINRASLNRHLSRDWIFSKDQILSFEMSHTQFSNFITSTGNGTGTPITLYYAPEIGAKSGKVPSIKNIETKSEIFHREVNESARKQIQALKNDVDQLGHLINSTSISKKEALEIHHRMTCKLQNLPADLEFVVKQAESAIEQAQAAAKKDIEAYVDFNAKRIGFDNIQKLSNIDTQNLIERKDHD